MMRPKVLKTKISKRESGLSEKLSHHNKKKTNGTYPRAKQGIRQFTALGFSRFVTFSDFSADAIESLNI